MDVRSVDPCRTDSDAYTSEPLVPLHWFGGIGMIVREKLIQVECHPFWVQSTEKIQPRAGHESGYNHGNTTYINMPLM